MADLNELERWLIEGPADQVTIAGLRISLRALPIATMGQDWSRARQQLLLETFRTLQAIWTMCGYSELGGSGWSDERLARLVTLWGAGRTASEISRSLGNVSRNAVIGKAHRLSLQSDRMGLLHSRGRRSTFDGELQEAAFRAVLAGTWPRWPEREGMTKPLGPADGLTALMRAATGISQIYPNLAPERFLEAIERDRRNLSSTGDLIAVARQPLWPSREGSQLRIELPDGWSFWRRWYDARRLGKPTEGMALTEDIDRAIMHLPDKLWSAGPVAVNREIAARVRALKNQVRDIDELSETTGLPDPRTLGEVETQSTIALTFKTSIDGRIDVDLEPPQGLRTDEDAQDRHTEVCDSARDLIGLYERFGLGANIVEPLVQQAERLLEALGPTPEKVRPGLLIPRGERLRQSLLAQQDADDPGCAPPLPAQYLTNLKVLVSAYNIYVAFDPILESRDQARLDPDLVTSMISKSAGKRLVESAVGAEIATPEVQDVIAEEAQNLVGVPDFSRRESRRYTESIRNFARVAIDHAFKPLKALWTRRSEVRETIGDLNKFARWVANHANALVALFPEGSTTHQIIRFIVEAAKRWS